MPRDRYIRDSFWRDPKVGALSPGARLLYVSLWNYCDDKGRGRGLPAELHAWAFLYDRNTTVDDVAVFLGELVSSGRVVVYESDGEQYIVLPRLLVYQYIRKPSKTRHPTPPRESLMGLDLPSELVDELVDDKAWSREKRQRAKSSLREARKSELETEKKEATETAQEKPKKKKEYGEDVKTVFSEWVKIMGKKANVKMSAKRARSVSARLRDGYTVNELVQAIRGCKLSSWHRGNNPDGVVYDDLELICRDTGKVDKFIMIAERDVECGRPGDDLFDRLTAE